MQRLRHLTQSCAAVAIGALALTAPIAAALADASFPPPMYPDGSNAVLPNARAGLGLAGAVKTNLFTQAWTGGIGNALTNMSGNTPWTMLQAVPFETPPYAVRIGLCNPYNADLVINSAAVYPSTDYSLAANVDANGGNVAVVPDNASFTGTGSGTSLTVTSVTGKILLGAKITGTGVPANTTISSQSSGTIGGAGVYVTNNSTTSSGAALKAIAGGESKLYFGNANASLTADNPQINDGTISSTRTVTLPAVTANTGNVAQACQIVWSDWNYFQALARTDGGTQTLGFFYLTIGASGAGYTYSMRNPGGAFSGATWNRGRKILCAVATTKTTDFADNPTGTGFQQGGGGSQDCPIIAIQYLGLNYGHQIMVTGDSLSDAPTNDSISSSLWRAAKDLSTPGNPIEVANFAWGGAAFAVYGEFYRQNLAAVKPSIVALQAISRNDGNGPATMQELFGKLLSYGTLAVRSYGSRIIWNQAGGEPSWDGNAAAIAGWNLAYGLMQGLGTTPPTPFIDCPSVIGNAAGGAPWDYLAGMSDDNTHPNVTGAQTCEPLATAALKAVQ